MPTSTLPQLPSLNYGTLPEEQTQKIGQSLVGAGLQDLSGVISPDVKTQIYQAMAERGVGMGQNPNAPINDSSLMRAIGLTSNTLRTQGENVLSPLYQQQVSELGQASRQAADIASRENIAKLQEAGLNERQANELAAAMERLRVSESGQDRRQAAELQAAMDRLKAGNANQMDIEKLREATQISISAADRIAAQQQLEQRLTAEQNMQTQRIGAQNQIEQDRIRQAEIEANNRLALGYAGLDADIYNQAANRGPTTYLANPGSYNPGSIPSYSSGGNVLVGGAQPYYYSGNGFQSYNSGNWSSAYPWGNYNANTQSFNTGPPWDYGSAPDEDWYNWAASNGLSGDIFAY